MVGTADRPDHPEGGSGGPAFLVVGQITKPHGTKGEVYVWPLTDRPDEVFAPGRELIMGDAEGEIGEDSSILQVERVRPFKRGVLVKFEGFPDRSAVEALGQHYLLLPAEHIAPLDEGELHYHQMLGLEVVTMAGETVGRIAEVYETEPAHLLDVRGEARNLLIPFVERIVVQVDLEAGRIVIDPPAGLLEL